MKDTELKLLCELMKNSRRSDRQLAKTTGLSQPTVSRAIKKLEEKGFIKEYAMIPDFSKLGFRVMAIIFTKLNKQISPDALEEIRKKNRRRRKEQPFLDPNGNDRDGLRFRQSTYTFERRLLRIFQIHWNDQTASIDGSWSGQKLCNRSVR
jgi:DNA-binding Lrp family transcriptional regulator